eukprot:scaffold21700_cov89-Isochrysis_galbana.AAC.2
MTPDYSQPPLGLPYLRRVGHLPTASNGTRHGKAIAGVPCNERGWEGGLERKVPGVGGVLAI